jgi:hypothetical protein
MADGATSYGTLTYTIPVGSLAPIFAENFEEVEPPALPPGWVTSGTNGSVLWTTTSKAPDTLPNAAFVRDGSNSQLDTPAIAISSPYTKVTFRHSYDLRFPSSDSYDGGVLEVSSPNINGGAFTDITDAAVGGNFVTGGYRDTLAYDNPLSGRMAWSQNSDGYITTIANLGPNMVGQAIKLRFRLSSSPYGQLRDGWRIDSLTVGTPVCGGNAPAIISAVSRKTQGAAGTFDINLPLVPLDGDIGIENRAGAVAGEHQIVVTFANAVTLSAMSVAIGNGRVANSSVNGAVVTINLTEVTGGQKIAISLPDVSDGVNLGSIVIPMGVLSGDTNASGAVDSSDLTQVKSQSGQPLTSANFREDVNSDGVINASDISIVKMKSGTALP